MSYVSRSTTPSSIKSPPIPLYFPLISLIKQLFGIDPETLVLLGALGRSSGAEADLFQSSPFDQSETTWDPDSNTGAPTSADPQSSQSPMDIEKGPVVAVLTQNDLKPLYSASAHSVKAGLRAMAEHQASSEEPNGSWTISLSFPARTSMDIFLSPVKLTSSIASGAVNAATGIFDHSGAVLSALSMLNKPVASVADVIGLRRSETVAAST